MSKFEFMNFYGGYDDFAVSKQRYSKEEAIKIAKEELKHRKHKYLAVGDGYVRHRAGVNEDNEPCVGWWIEYKEHKRSCPCWIFHTTNKEYEKFKEDYEYVEFERVEVENE